MNYSYAMGLALELLSAYEWLAQYLRITRPGKGNGG